MVQFGKTLNEVVKSDWRCHAVAYMELKRALSERHHAASFNTMDKCGADDGPCSGVDSKCGINGVNGCVDPTVAHTNENVNTDADSVHTESSYRISDAQKANFFHIYEDSIKRLTNFYDNRVQWARNEREVLEKAVGKQIVQEDSSEGKQSGEQTKDDQRKSSISFLIQQITNFSRDLGLALEFLELNATAFSKIMKKFDKRTGSNLREAKLKQLKAQHPYLYEGGELKKCKNLCAEWIKKLQLMLPQLSSSAHSSRKANRVSRTVQNSLQSGDGDKIASLVQAEEVDVDECENPQESGEMPRKVNTQKDGGTKKKGKEPSVGFLAPRSIHQTKDSQILQKMIDRVNEELCLQKADSPFFDKTLEQNAPPSFMTSEVELADMLGEGEFCKIYEVSRFNVPESCHICFLHRGYQDPDPFLKEPPEDKLKAPKKATHRRIPSSVVMPDISPEVGGAKSAPTKDEGPPIQANQTIPASQPLETTTSKLASNFSFDYDANISDYDDLESDHEEDYHQDATRGFMKDHCLRNGEARYAIKRIKSCLVGEEDITDAAIDLAREAEILASLKHPNIIRIRGTINVPGHPKYGLILDRLYDTLEVQMKKWKVDLKRYQGKFKGLIGKNKMMINKMWMSRLIAANDLARAMAYLHGCGILHRDIKPANIGFDIRGDIKIFDFGLAKELKPSQKEGKDQYHTSGLAGTRRYMAPEVCQVMPYGLSADVYSFGILFWEMLTLKAAFEKYTREKHYKEVVVEGKRPKISKSWPFVIKNLLERCWHELPSERPTFQAVCELIKFGLPSEKTADMSDRSDDLLMRSYRSTQCYDSFKLESDHNDESNGVNIVKTNTSSDALSQSIRIKSSNMDLHRHKGH
ncbi:hypothetical protein ACHAXR_005473 [Thalassiosira sp. AJA248-18]